MSYPSYPVYKHVTYATDDIISQSQSYFIHNYTPAEAVAAYGLLSNNAVTREGINQDYLFISNYYQILHMFYYT